MARERVTVLMDSSSRDDFMSAANELGLEHLTTHEPSDAHDPYKQTWTTRDRETTVCYIEDPVFRQRYIWLKGDVAREVEEDLERSLVVFGSELIELVWIAETAAERIDAVLRLGVAFIEYSGLVEDAYVHGLEDPEPGVRRATLMAIGKRNWPELRHLVQRVAAGDRDEQVRTMAQWLLVGYPPAPEPVEGDDWPF